MNVLMSKIYMSMIAFATPLKFDTGIPQLDTGLQNGENILAGLGNMLVPVVGIGAFIWMLKDKEKGKSLAIIVMIVCCGIFLVQNGFIETLPKAIFGG